MSNNQLKVSVRKYARNSECVKSAVETAKAFTHLPRNAKVVIKPNIVVWINGPFPKWGVITTSVIMEETVLLLKEHGINDISIIEGTIRLNPYEKHIGQKSFIGLGYEKLSKKYGVKLLDVLERPFEKVEIADGLNLKINADVMASDFLVNLPVLKTHAQVKVSLGIKNLKGFLSVGSRKKCHSADRERDLDYMISCLPNFMPPSATIIDGIYTLERGPGFDGKPRKTDLVVVSANVLAADMVGAKILGHDPSDIAYLSLAAESQGASIDFSNIKILGENMDDVTAYHEFNFPYNTDNTLPVSMEKMGIKGLKFHKYDSTLCTYCSALIGTMINIIAMFYKGKPFDDVEFLTGKRLTPSKDMKKSILVGQCMCNRNKDHVGHQEIVKINGCPPDPYAVATALKSIGIDVDPSLFTNYELAGTFFMEKLKKKPEFYPSYYTIS